MKYGNRLIDVFFYGLFMDADALRAKGLNPTNIRIAKINDSALRIGQRATLVPSAGSMVWGVAMSLTHAQIDSLYAESTVRAYRPEAVLVHSTSGEVFAALCFNLIDAPASDERNPDYAMKLRALAERVGLPAEYVAGITSNRGT